MTTLEIERKNGVALGICEDTLVIYYDRSPTLESVRTVELATAHPAVVRLERILALIVIDAISQAPEANVRAALQKSIKSHQSRMVGLAYTILGTGFGNAGARAVVSGMLLLMKPKYPTKVFASVPMATDWLLTQGDALPPNTKRTQISRPEQLKWLSDFCSPAGVGFAQQRYG